MNAENDYLKTFRGRFVGILRWDQLDDLWARVRDDADGGWYIYAVGAPPPEAPATAEQVQRFIGEVDELLHREHEEKYCGIVYADDPEHPGFIKIFDPNNLGVVCGYSENPPLPGWVMSKMKPIDLPDALPQTGSRRRWWQKLFG
ncbi:MAG: hypothetical protein D6717_02065 [Gammaproteobacteria bacterium]|nr:MAG: hypothetical protein D6717_02065 [Gammaproteobacteria bacterium]